MAGDGNAERRADKTGSGMAYFYLQHPKRCEDLHQSCEDDHSSRQRRKDPSSNLKSADLLALQPFESLAQFTSLIPQE